MYFSRITLAPTANAQQLARTLCQNVYKEHQILWQLFADDPDAQRDFLYHQVLESGHLKYYLVSKRAPKDPTGVWTIAQPKPYTPKLAPGQTLIFTLRANPVITTTGQNGRKQRHDVVMHEKKRMGFNQLSAHERPPLSHLIQTSCSGWLQARGHQNGFSVNPAGVNVEGYRQHTIFIKRKERPVRYSTVDLAGTLTVTDPEKFTQALYQGLGKSKAFGCGLLLVKPLPANTPSDE